MSGSLRTARASAITLVILVIAGWTLTLSPALTNIDALAGDGIRAVLPASFGPVTDAIAVLCGSAGGVWVLVALMFVVLLVRSSLRDALTFGARVAGGCVACWVVKALVERPAPGLESGGLGPAAQSFPSGHVAFAASVAVALWLVARRTRWAAPVAIAGTAAVLVVAASRIYLGVHYPSDAIAGAAVAVAGAGLASAAVRALQRALAARTPTTRERQDTPT